MLTESSFVGIPNLQTAEIDWAVDLGAMVRRQTHTVTSCVTKCASRQCVLPLVIATPEQHTSSTSEQQNNTENNTSATPVQHQSIIRASSEQHQSNISSS
jgi:hypothetical protein